MSRTGSEPPPAPRDDEAFRLLVDSVSDYAIFMLAVDGTVATWNVGAERIKGYRADEIIGRPYATFFPPEDVQAGLPAQALETAARDGRFASEGFRLRKDGSRFWASVVLTALRDARGSLRGYAKVTRDMTERKLALDALKQSEEHLTATLDSIGDAVMATDAHGAVTRLNPVAERLTGYSKAEALGRPLQEIFRIVNEDTREPVVSPVEAVLREGRIVGLANHTALIAKDGSERPIADSGAPIRGLDGKVRGAVLVFRDVSDEREAERALRESEERFRLLVQGVKDYAICMLDARGRVVSWNAGAELITGHAEGEIVGRDFGVFYTEQDVQSGKPARDLDSAARDGRCEEECVRVRKDGTSFWANVVLTPVHDEHGALRGFASVTCDVTERREAERTARRLEVEIAARKAAEAGEARLRASEERYRQQSEQLAIILEGVADGITAQRATGELLYANDAAAHSCGYPTAEALLRAQPSEILERFETYDEQGKPFDWTRLPGRRALAGEHNPSVELRIREKASGDEWWSMIRARAVRNEQGVPYLAVNIWRDISEQRRRELDARFLAEATAVLSGGIGVAAALDQLAKLCVPHIADWCVVHLFESGTLVPIGISHVESAKVEAVRELLKRYPIDPRRPVGAPRVVRTGRPELIEEVTDAMLSQAIRDPERLQAARGLGIKSALVVPLHARGRTLGALALAFAESNRRYRHADLALAEELGRRAGLAVDNARLYEEAQTAIQARDEFLSIAGHELKTPLAALLLQIGSLLRLHQRGDLPSSERTLDKLRKAESQAQRLHKLIDELLDVSRITSGRLLLELEDVELVGLSEEIVTRFAEEASRAGCELELRASGRIPGRWDRLRIDQVLTNLIANALKYGAGKPVEVELGPGEGTAVLSVRDRGIGIAPEHQARIFGRFERAVSERYYGGFGLGLWISRQIIEAHGGSIRLDSREGAGSTFTVTLPLVQR